MRWPRFRGYWSEKLAGKRYSSKSSGCAPIVSAQLGRPVQYICGVTRCSQCFFNVSSLRRAWCSAVDCNGKGSTQLRGVDRREGDGVHGEDTAELHAISLQRLIWLDGERCWSLFASAEQDVALRWLSSYRVGTRIGVRLPMHLELSQAPTPIARSTPGRVNWNLLCRENGAIEERWALAATRSRGTLTALTSAPPLKV